MIKKADSRRFDLAQVSISLFLYFWLTVQFPAVVGWGGLSRWRRRQKVSNSRCDLEYDLVIIGSGASGMFASGAATMLGSKTLLLDVWNETSSNIGGDCTNSACVPSKAVRSMARLALGDPSVSLVAAQRHARSTVGKVRNRENPAAMVEGNPNLDIMLISHCHFTSPHEMILSVCKGYSSNRTLPKNATSVMARSKKFLIATGAAPIVPDPLKTAAAIAKLPIYTYRTLLGPIYDNEDPKSIWNFLEGNSTKSVVIAGGGATACEIGQSLARLGQGRLEIHLVAPTLLPGEDVTMADAAAQLLTKDGVKLYLGRRLDNILPDRSSRLSDGTLLSPSDALILCLGRNPAPALETLRLENANVAWNETTGVLVKSNLRSVSAPQIFACGDCSSAASSKPQSRTATHAAWTGYHAAMNTKVPLLLRLGSKSIHSTVPRVVYTDPELASVGLSYQDCISKYGRSGFDRLFVPEENTDRADMECVELSTLGFVEIRATKIDGKILGFTGCGPAASELCNEMSLAIENGLSVRDVARSLHSYPSHGYLVHRVALALSFNTIWGLLEACGVVGGILAKLGRIISKTSRSTKAVGVHRRTKLLRMWEAEGVGEGILVNELPGGYRYFEDSTKAQGTFRMITFLDAYGNLELREELYRHQTGGNRADDFKIWAKRKPTIDGI